MGATDGSTARRAGSTRSFATLNLFVVACVEADGRHAGRPRTGDMARTRRHRTTAPAPRPMTQATAGAHDLKTGAPYLKTGAHDLKTLGTTSHDLGEVS